MHDVLDIIRNVQCLSAVGPTLGILKDFERVIDELDVYVFKNWSDGELLQGPIDSRHFVTCSFMWPEEKMPDPAGGKRLLDRGCKVSYKKDELLKKEILLKDINFLVNKEFFTNEIFVKVRSTGKLLRSKLYINNGSTKLILLEDEYGISPGQACVFYSKDEVGDKVLGGGWITKN